MFDKTIMGDLELKNRVVMAPMTRSRAPQEIPTEMMIEYYCQRVPQFAFAITEGSHISKMAVGYPFVPGIWNEQQVEGWKKVTDAVHKLGGVLFLQLWHVGRVSAPFYLNGHLPLAPSAIAPDGKVFSLDNPNQDYVIPKAMTEDDIKKTIEEFVVGAKNAKKAGFDGVELHGANGYLLDQFLQDGSNKRADKYGGSVENRMRFPLEVLDGVLSIWNSNRVGYHIAPRCDLFSMGDSDRLSTFSALMREFNKRNIAFVFAREKIGNDSIGPKLKEIFNNLFIANEQLSKESAQQLLDEKKADMVGFGQLALANPDLINRFMKGSKLNKPNKETFYGGNEVGYIDYPALGLV